MPRYWIVAFSVLVLLMACEMNKSEEISVIADHVQFKEDAYRRIVQDVNRLGLDLIKDVDRDEDKNALISPTSLYMLLSILYNGADGATKLEMAEVLGVKSYSKEEVSEANASLITALHKQRDDLSLHIANSMWIRDQYSFETDFKNRAEDFFNGEINEVNMADAATLERINGWVKEATRGRIEEIIEGPLDPALVSLLVNAVYFNGDWTYAFDKRQTMTGSFHGEAGESYAASFMTLERELPYFAGKSFQSVSLPYGEGEMSMNIFLPREGYGLDDFISELNVREWSNYQENYVPKEGSLILPKFKLEYETILNESLIKLGLGQPFDPILADFSEMLEGEERVYIDLMKQKTYIDVHEEGTEAAAVTSAQVRLTSAPVDPPFYMNVNRPFLFTIKDVKTGVILFIGVINQPKD